MTVFACAFACAQKPADTYKKIQNDPNYIYGVGKGATVKAASQMALEELVTSISTSVESSFEYRMKTVEADDQSHTSADVKQLVNTYSKMTLNGTKTLDISSSKDKEKTVVRYLTKADLQKMFDERGEKVKNYVKSARRAAKRSQVGTALQNFYWAMSLLNSYPDGDRLQVEDDDYHSQYAYTWIPVQMKALLSKISITAKDVQEDEEEKLVTVDVTYNGTPADDINFTCTDGESDPSDLIASKNGVGEIFLPRSAKEKKLVATIDYRGLDEANRDPELADVISANAISFKEAVINLGRDLWKKQQKQTTFADVEKAKADVVKMDNPTASTNDVAKAEEVKDIVRYLNAEEAKEFIPVAKQIEIVLRQRHFDDLKPMCTDEGWEHVQKLLKYGSARLVGYPNIQFLDNNGDITVRSYPMSFQFKSNNKRKFLEDVVFHLDKTGKITSVAFALDKRSADDIFCHKGNWTDQSKQTIVNFMESYKTAYALRDIDYIDRIFSDDALILVGRVVKTAPKKSELQMTNTSNVEYIRKTKGEYMRDLERAFNSNEYINIKFGETEVKKAGYTNRTTGKPMEVYGIQLKQDYFSQHYGDTGYLFLAVDLTDAGNPVIHIRTWQPEKDVTGGSRFGLQDLQ